MKKIFSLITIFLGLICNNIKAQITIEQVAAPQTRYTPLDTDSIDLHKYGNSEEKKYGINALDFYKKYIGQRFLIYSEGNLQAYTPKRTILTLPSPINMIMYSKDKKTSERKDEGTYIINRISTYKYSPYTSLDTNTKYRGVPILGDGISFTDKKGRSKYFLKFPGNFAIKSKFSVQYLTLKNVMLWNSSTQLFQDTLAHQTTPMAIYRSMINGKEYFSTDIKDDIYIDDSHKNAYPNTHFYNEPYFIFLMEDENGTEFYCNLLGSGFIGVQHIDYLKQRYVSKYIRRWSFIPENEPIYKVHDVVIREFYAENDYGEQWLDHYIALKAENLSTGNIIYISVEQENGVWGLGEQTWVETFPKSYEMDENGIIDFSNTNK